MATSIGGALSRAGTLAATGAGATSAAPSSPHGAARTSTRPITSPAAAASAAARRLKPPQRGATAPSVCILMAPSLLSIAPSSAAHRPRGRLCLRRAHSRAGGPEDAAHTLDQRGEAEGREAPAGSRRQRQGQLAIVLRPPIERGVAQHGVALGL